MNHRIEDYIRETPTRLHVIHSGAQSLFAPLANAEFDRIIVSGSGTSFHSAAQMQQAMRLASGLDVHAVYPFAVTPELLGDGTRTLFVGVSQGGGSLSVLEAMKAAKAAGCTIATMCGTKNAVIDAIADHVFTVDVGEENAGAKTKGYYGTKLNLFLLAQAIGRDRGVLDGPALEDSTARLQATIDRFYGITEKAEAWVRKNSSRLAATEDLRFVGPASLYGDTLEVALKAVETLRVPVSAYEFNEFIHGIYNAINESSFVILLDDGSEPRMPTMVATLREWTENVVVIGTGDESSTDLYLGDVPRDEFQTFLFPIAGQMISALVPRAKGYDPAVPKDPAFHDRLSSKER